MALTVLLTSLGSGVVTAILDCLEGRRDNLVVIGIGSDPAVPDRVRCDHFIRVPLTADPNWSEAVTAIAHQTRARAIIPGRCDDVVALARLADANELLRDALIVGPSTLAARLRDTGLAAEFAREIGLPFAPTARTGLPDSDERVAGLLRQHEGPWIIKPSSGQGSRGVRMTRDPMIVREAATLAGHVVQPFLSAAPLEFGSKAALHVIDLPAIRDSDVQVMLGPDSTVLATGAFATTMSGGRVLNVEVHPDPAVLDLAIAYGEALSAAGWRGPVNIQAAQGRDGRWLPFEINPRFSGGSHARAQLGFDEVFWCLQAWLGTRLDPHRSG